jgi:signal peptidase I
MSVKPIAADEGKSSAVAVVREYLDALIVAGLAALFLITFVIRTFYIPSGSMVPTLLVRDVLLVNEIEYRLHSPRPGDIAVFTPPIDAAGNEFIKRVIGVPGDTIRISDGIVYRNGKPLDEPYEYQAPAYNLEIRNYGIYVDDGDGTMRPLEQRAANIPPRTMWQAPDRIPIGFYFMLGDNRRESDDSHLWGFAQMNGTFAAGPLSASHAQAGFAGRAFLIFWPLDRLHVLH